MTDPTHDELLERLEAAVGDGLTFIARYTLQDSEILYGEEWFEQYTQAVDARSRDNMHQDGVHRLEQAAVGSQLYETEVYAETTITENGVGIYLYPSDELAYFVWVGTEATVELPTLVEECLEAIDVDP